MNSQKDLYDLALERQMYADLDKMQDEKVHYTLINDLFSKNKEFDHDFIWDIYLEQIKRRDYNLDKNTWNLNGELRYPQSSFEESSKLIEFCFNQIKNIDSDINVSLDLIDSKKGEFIKILILIKVLSLAIRRYPQSLDKTVFDSITSDSHWIKYASKCLIYINSGCEYGSFSHHSWEYEKTEELCSANSSAFFISSLCSAAFWVPLTALMFDKLAEKYKPHPKLIEFINDYGFNIRNAFFPNVEN